MKNYLTLVAISLIIASNMYSQNAITLNQHNATINLGDSIEFAVTLSVQTGYDASVFLSTNCIPEGIAIVSPSIINYPYSKSVVASFKTLKYYKKGTYIVTVTASIGSILVSDSCIVVVHNASPWRIFNSMYDETRPGCVVVDKKGAIYFSHLSVSRYSWTETPGGSARTYLSNPIFKDAPSYGPPIKVWSIFLDDVSENQYFSTEQGLHIYKSSGTTIYNTSTSAIPSNGVKRVCLDGNGRLWIGTILGLASLENYTITPYDITNTDLVLGRERITALAVDSRDRVWIGTPTGLVMKDGNTWRRYTPENSGLPAPYIFSLVEDNNGSMWMGAGKSDKYFGVNDCPKSMVGLVKFDGTIWTQFNSANSPLSSNYVNGLTIDKKGNLWIATSSYFVDGLSIVSGCGLLKYDGANWTTFNTSNSLLPDNDVQWVGTDRTGNIWFSCKAMFGVMNEEGIPFLVNDVEEQPETTDNITISPNPTSTIFTISGIDNISDVKIVNSLGMEVKQWLMVDGQLNLEVDVSDLASGLYFVQIRTPTGMITKSIIVSH